MNNHKSHVGCCQGVNEWMQLTQIKPSAEGLALGQKYSYMPDGIKVRFREGCTGYP